MTPQQMATLHTRCFSVPRPWSADEFARLLSDHLCFTLFESGGFIVGRVVADEAEILTLAVDPEARRLGVGARLVEGVLTQANLRGAALVFLEVAANNDTAISLYLRAGFATVGLRRGYYTPPSGAALDAVVMSRAV